MKKHLCVVALSVVAVLVYAETPKMRCKKCDNKGYVVKTIDCPLCGGYGSVSPAWFGKVTNTERWTVTTYLLTGAQTESEHRVKKMSFMKCPCCARSSKIGTIKTIEKCDCGADVPEKKVEESVLKFKKAFNTPALAMEAKEIDFDSDKFKFFRIAYEAKCWAYSNFGKDDAVRLIKQAIDGKYDTEGANYLRETTKKDLKDDLGSMKAT